MTLRSLVEAWNNFFFAPQSPSPVCLFRIFYGCAVIATLILLHHDWLDWYGGHGWVTPTTMHAVEPGTRLNLFDVIPQNDYWINGLFWFFLASAILLTVGFLTRLSTVSVFLCLTSIHQRNLFIIHSGDAFLRVAGFFLMFAPAGAAFSIDHLMGVRKGKERPRVQPTSPWAQRMIQFEFALVYFVSFGWKSMGSPWVNGTALYYLIHLHEIQRFPLPHWIAHPVILKLGSWFTLALEFSLGVLIWINELRYPLLLLGVCFHLCLEYAFNIPMFQWDILSAYVLFVDAADIARAENWLRNLSRQYLSRRAQQTASKGTCSRGQAWSRIQPSRRFRLKLLP